MAESVVEESRASRGGWAGRFDAMRSERGIVTLAMLLAMTVTALEQTVVSTAMPQIIASLRGVDIYPWVFSAYLLAVTISTPIYGKLADIFGRKRLLLFGLGLFAAGSMLSGMAGSMPQLIAMRTIQGLGAGAVGPIVLTMIADMYTLRERAKVQGWFSGVWGLSSVAGPFLGGVLTQNLSWRWCFYVTVPFGVLAAWILVRHVKETIGERAAAPIDWAGAILLGLASAALLLAALKGTHWPMLWIGPLAVGSLVLFVMFVMQERRAVDPVLPLDLIADRRIASAIAGNLLVGSVFFAVEMFVPLYMQGVRGRTPTSSGWMMTPLFLAWASSVAVAAKVIVRLGFRGTGVVGSALMLIGVLGLFAGALWPEASRLLMTAGMFVIGVGIGPASLSMILSVQNAVAWGRRGVATAATVFARTMGGALGVGLLGAFLDWELLRSLHASGLHGIDASAVLRHDVKTPLAAEHVAIFRDALGGSIGHVLLLMAALAVLIIVCAFGLPPGRADQPHPDAVPDPSPLDENALAFAEI